MRWWIVLIFAATLADTAYGYHWPQETLTDPQQKELPIVRLQNMPDDEETKRTNESTNGRTDYNNLADFAFTRLNEILPDTIQIDIQYTNRESYRKQENWWNLIFDWIFDAKITDILLALFTGLLVLYTRRLYVSTRGMESATERLVIGAEVTAIRQLAAYLGVTTESPIPSIECAIIIEYGNAQVPHTAIDVNLFLKNFGNTPAYDVVDVMGIQIREVPLSTALPNLPLPQGKRGKSIINPGQAITLSGRTNYPMDYRVLTQVETQGMAIYIYGRIEYNDIYRREVRFVNYRLMSRSADPRSVNFEVCPEGNDAN